jgi:uncharacterized protein (TIGR03083 family)
MNEIWAAVHRERDALADDVTALDAGQWTMPSLCPGWDVHAVLAHLVDGATTTRLGFIRRMIAAGFDFDRMNASGIARERTIDPTLTLANFRRVRGRRTSPPAPLVTRLVEVFVHGEDIRRPLGIAHEYPITEVLMALRYQATASVDFGGGNERVERLRLIATDASFDLGMGPEVHGSAIALLLAVSGRPVRGGEITGPGALSLTATDGN